MTLTTQTNMDVPTEEINFDWVLCAYFLGLRAPSTNGTALLSIRYLSEC